LEQVLIEYHNVF